MTDDMREAFRLWMAEHSEILSLSMEDMCLCEQAHSDGYQAGAEAMKERMIAEIEGVFGKQAIRDALWNTASEDGVYILIGRIKPSKVNKLIICTQAAIAEVLRKVGG